MDLLVSFIIPAYNASTYIVDCLNSIIRIKMPTEKFEVIVVNDGSNDNTIEMIENRFLSTYNNIILINQDNTGVAAARNTGLHHAKGKWICFIDADDYLNSDNFALFEKLFEEDNIDIIQGLYLDTIELADTNVKPLSSSQLIALKSTTPIKLFDPKKCGAYGNIYNRQFLFNKKIEFPIGIKVAEDLFFTLQCFLMASNCIRTNVMHYYYRINDTSCMTTMTKSKLLDSSEVLGRIFKLTSKYAESSQFIIQQVILYHLNVNLWYISHYKSLFLERKEILNKLQSELEGIIFNGSIKNSIFTFLFHHALNTYVAFKYYLSKTKYD